MYSCKDLFHRASEGEKRIPVPETLLFQNYESDAEKSQNSRGFPIIPVARSSFQFDENKSAIKLNSLPPDSSCTWVT